MFDNDSLTQHQTVKERVSQEREKRRQSSKTQLQQQSKSASPDVRTVSSHRKSRPYLYKRLEDNFQQVTKSQEKLLQDAVLERRKEH
jgi:hypothetical protein